MLVWQLFKRIQEQAGKKCVKHQEDGIESMDELYRINMQQRTKRILSDDTYPLDN